MVKRRRLQSRRRRVKRRRRTRKLSLRRSLLPLTFAARLPYHMSIQLNASAFAPAVNVFSANGLYDPDITGVGHQPRGFDQMMVLYDHYVVIGAKITVRFMGDGYQSETAKTQCVGFININDETTVMLFEDYAESLRCKYKQISHSSGYPTTLSYKINPAKFLGRSKALADPQLKGSDAANPLEGCFFHVGVQSINSADPSLINVMVDIDYFAVFIEPKDMVSS